MRGPSAATAAARLLGAHAEHPVTGGRERAVCEVLAMRRLHAAALNRLGPCGSTHPGLWVLDTNKRVLGFYYRHGWTDTGRSQLDRGTGGAELHERRLHRDLSD